ncbi:MAG: thioredoxin [Lachnospiraceae bacterium]|nr:thioredoxin [Lachnospiraceae bacterium]
MILGAILIIAGVILGQPAAVLAKAVRICMECVGLG